MGFCPLGDLSLLDIQLPGVTSTSVNTIDTKNFKLTITNPSTVAGTSSTFSAVAERANNGTVLTSGDNQYAITLSITAAGVISRKCTSAKGATTVNAICKSISNGSSTGEIK